MFPGKMPGLDITADWRQVMSKLIYTPLYLPRYIFLLMKTSFPVYWFPLALTVWLAVPAVLVMPASAQGQPRDLVGGNLIQFNDNGAWTWYSDERAIIDTTGGKLVVGVDVCGTGLGGSPRDGAVGSNHIRSSGWNVTEDHFDGKWDAGARRSQRAGVHGAA